MNELPAIDHQLNRQRLALARNLAKMLDSAFTIPGTNQRFGLDSILGFAPIVGDILPIGVSLYIVYLAQRMGVPRKDIYRMLANVGMDAAIGAVPLAGDIMDIFFKANLKNLALMERHLEYQEFGRLPKPTLLEGLFGRRRRRPSSVPPQRQTIDIVPEHRLKDKS